MKRQRIISIEAKNIAHSFDEGKDELIKSLDFKIPMGKNIVIEGAPGSGKSILLKILSGIVEPSEGTVFYNHMSLKEISFEEFIPLRLSTAVSFENGGLLMNKTLIENLQLALFYHDQWRKERSQVLLEKLIENFELKRFLHLRPASVSAGIRKMAGIVRAFLINPQVLFLDEPTLGLGEKGIAAVRQWMERFAETRKPDETIIMCSSDREFLKTFNCIRYEIEAGKIRLKSGDTRSVA